MVPKKIVLNVLSDSTSWQITLAKSLPFLLSHLAPYFLESISEKSKMCPLRLSEKKFLKFSWSQICLLSRSGLLNQSQGDKLWKTDLVPYGQPLPVHHTKSPDPLTRAEGATEC